MNGYFICVHKKCKFPLEDNAGIGDCGEKMVLLAKVKILSQGKVASFDKRVNSLLQILFDMCLK